MSVWLAGRIMEYDQYPEMISLIEKHIEISFFVDSGFVLLQPDSHLSVDSIASLIISSFKNYLKQ